MQPSGLNLDIRERDKTWNAEMDLQDVIDQRINFRRGQGGALWALADLEASRRDPGRDGGGPGTLPQ